MNLIDALVCARSRGSAFVVKGDSDLVFWAGGAGTFTLSYEELTATDWEPSKQDLYGNCDVGLKVIHVIEGD